MLKYPNFKDSSSNNNHNYQQKWLIKSNQKKQNLLSWMMNLLNRQELFKSLLNILKAPQKFQLLKYNQAQALTMRTRSQKRNSNLQKSPNIIRNLSKQEHQIDNNMLRDTSNRYHNNFSSLRNYWRHSITV